jgi:hypothetical protein
MLPYSKPGGYDVPIIVPVFSSGQFKIIHRLPLLPLILIERFYLTGPTPSSTSSGVRFAALTPTSKRQTLPNEFSISFRR